MVGVAMVGVAMVGVAMVGVAMVGVAATDPTRAAVALEDAITASATVARRRLLPIDIILHKSFTTHLPCRRAGTLFEC
jgi:hypothetical protein